MQTRIHRLSNKHASVQAELTSLHFGQPHSRKAYIQAALHADEVPAMLVAQCLRKRLQELEAQGYLSGEVVLVPAANPFGLAQVINERPHGRFDLSTGINYNRDYPHYGPGLVEKVRDELTADASQNVALIRAALRASIAEWAPRSDAERLKKALLGMAIDADVVLDLHSDNEAALHLYTGSALQEAVLPLAHLLEASALLHTHAAGGEPFDEACSRLWWELQAAVGPRYPVPPACIAATVELRGEADVDYGQASKDADAIILYLALQGIIDLPDAGHASASCAATPLEGVERIDAPHSGMLVYRAALGQKIAAGTPIADLIDPVSGHTTALRSSVDGVFFARLSHRYVICGMNVGKVAGAHAFRQGNLLSL